MRQACEEETVQRSLEPPRKAYVANGWRRHISEAGGKQEGDEQEGERSSPSRISDLPFRDGGSGTVHSIRPIAWRVGREEKRNDCEAISSGRNASHSSTANSPPSQPSSPNVSRTINDKTMNCYTSTSDNRSFPPFSSTALTLGAKCTQAFHASELRRTENVEPYNHE